MNTPARHCRRLLAGAAVAALILSACGDDDDSAESATAEPTAEAPAATTAAPASTVPAEATAGSATAGGDVPEGAMTEHDGWEAAELDDLWQAEQWGEDVLATAAREDKRRDFRAAARFLGLLE